MKYALDSNLFIDAFRSVDEEAALLAFHARFAPFEHLSAVVALELRAGARTKSALSKLKSNVLTPFERTGRVFAPGYSAWKDAGAALAELGESTRAFYNDVLLAASCREHGVTLVTRNVKDFTRIHTHLAFDFVVAWP